MNILKKFFGMFLVLLLLVNAPTSAIVGAKDSDTEDDEAKICLNAWIWDERSKSSYMEWTIEMRESENLCNLDEYIELLMEDPIGIQCVIISGNFVDKETKIGELSIENYDWICVIVGSPDDEFDFDSIMHQYTYELSFIEINYLIWNDETKEVTEMAGHMSIRRGERLSGLSDASKYYIMSDPVVELNGSDKFGYVSFQEEDFFLLIKHADPNNINLDEIWMASEDTRTKIPVYSLIWDNEKRELKPIVFNVFKGEHLIDLQINGFVRYFILPNGVFVPHTAMIGKLPLTSNDDRLFIITNIPFNQNLHNLDLPPILKKFSEPVYFHIASFDADFKILKSFTIKVYRTCCIDILRQAFPDEDNLTFIFLGNIINPSNMFGQLPLDENNLIVVICGEKTPNSTVIENWYKLYKDQYKFDCAKKNAIKSESSRLRDLRMTKMSMKKGRINKTKPFNSEQNLKQEGIPSTTNLAYEKTDEPTAKALPVIWDVK